MMEMFEDGLAVPYHYRRFGQLAATAFIGKHGRSPECLINPGRAQIEMLDSLLREQPAEDSALAEEVFRIQTDTRLAECFHTDGHWRLRRSIPGERNS